MSIRDAGLVQQILEKMYSNASPSWYSAFFYHYSGIQNIVSILKSGYLYCRNHALNNIDTQNASEDVLRNTSDIVKNCVRLYFRPKTPTQYHNEGYKPTELRKDYYKNVDIPVPIFLLFDSKSMLLDSKTKFSETALNKQNIDLTDDLKRVLDFDFQTIYSNNYEMSAKDTIVRNKRHAEIVVEHEYSLKNLSWIVCRSNAEMQTLIYYLQREGILEKYQSKIIIKGSSNLFNKRSLYIDNVSQQNNLLEINIVNLHLVKQVSQDILLKVLLETDSTSYSFLGSLSSNYSRYTIELPKEIEQNYVVATVSVFIDDHEMYRSNINIQNIPII